MRRGFFIIFILTHCLNAKDCMDRRSIFLEFRNFYEAIHPAEENSETAYAWFSPISNPFLNLVIHLSCEDTSAKVDELMRKNVWNCPMTFWIHPENRAEGLEETLKERDFSLLITCPAMTWAIEPVAACPADIRHADKKAVYEMISCVYKHEETVKKECLTLLEQLPCEDYIFYVDEKPVSSASLFVHGSVGEVFNDATLPQWGGACKEMMQFLMHRAYQLELERLIVLSYPEAQELYSELGFVTLFDVKIYSQ